MGSLKQDLEITTYIEIQACGQTIHAYMKIYCADLEKYNEGM